MKNYLARLKRNYMYKVMPLNVSHWNENKNQFEFFILNKNSEIVKKPLWLKMAEAVLYGAK